MGKPPFRYLETLWNAFLSVVYPSYHSLASPTWSTEVQVHPQCPVSANANLWPGLLRIWVLAEESYINMAYKKQSAVLRAQSVLKEKRPKAQ